MVNRKLFTLLLILLTGCINSINSVLQKNPCTPPCFYGITPGQTSKEEALDQLNNIPEMNKQSLALSSDPLLVEDEYQWKFTNSFEYGGSIIFSDEIAEVIEIYSGREQLSNIINLYGEPETYFSFYQQYESMIWIVIFFYPDEGLIVSTDSIYSHNLQNALVDETTRIANITFIAKEDMVHYLTNNLPKGIEENLILLNTHKWSGYGELESIKIN